MPPMRIVPALDELKHLAAGLALRPEGPPLDQLALERGEETLRQGVIIGVSDRAR